MLVTVSGMVGSGKSTAVAHLVELLRLEGVQDVEAWNFRSLPCFIQGRAEARSGTTDPGSATVPDERGRNYRRRRLTASLALGYASRVLAFRVYRRLHPGAHVCNRYFFDNFSHFELRTRLERCWFTFVRALVPRPDLAVLMMASPDTIASRRPMYSREYLAQVGMGYGDLQRHFPALRRVVSDPGCSFDELDAAVRRLLRTKRG